MGIACNFPQIALLIVSDHKVTPGVVYVRWLDASVITRTIGDVPGDTQTLKSV